MHPPVEWTKKWAYDNPWQALFVLVFGVTMVGLSIWILVSDYLHGVP